RRPPSGASQRRSASSSSPPAPVPRRPTRKSGPSPRPIGGRRGPGGGAAPQPAVRRTPRRLAAANRRNELLHARTLDRQPHVAVSFHRRADDHAVGQRQELRDRLGGDSAPPHEANLPHPPPPPLALRPGRPPP